MANSRKFDTLTALFGFQDHHHEVLTMQITGMVEVGHVPAKICQLFYSRPHLANEKSNHGQ
jgi:hypothetical protein